MIKKVTIFLGVFIFAYGLVNAQVDVERGKAFFKKKCKNCHKITEQVLVGPGLKGVTKRRSEEWLVKWLGSSKKERFSSGDPIATELLKKYKVKMPTIFEFRKEEGLLESVLDYLKTL